MNISKRKTKWICFEGVEGVGKTTQTSKLVEYLREKGYKVLQTKEPGTPLSPLTMELRNIMLNAKYDKEMTLHARELISQAIRSIHIEKVVRPAFNEYDFIVQDRGILSGLAYGDACGNEPALLGFLSGLHSLHGENHSSGLSVYKMYDDVIYLKGDPDKGLAIAKSAKQEFAEGDAIEAKGAAFMNVVSKNMDAYSSAFNTRTVYVDGKDIEQVFSEIVAVLDLP